jgi:hypothetical protein
MLILLFGFIGVWTLMKEINAILCLVVSYTETTLFLLGERHGRGRVVELAGGGARGSPTERESRGSLAKGGRARRRQGTALQPSPRPAPARQRVAREEDGKGTE